MTIDKFHFNIKGKLGSLLEIHRSKIKYGKSTLWLLSERVARIISGVFVTAYVARYLGPENWGIIGYSFFLVNVFGALAFTPFGLNALVVKYILSRDWKLEHVLGSAAFLKLLGGVLQIFCVACLTLILREDTIIWVCVGVIAAGVLFEPLFIIQQPYIANAEAGYPAAVQLVATVIQSAYRLFLIHAGADLVLFASAFLIEKIIVSVGLILTYHIKFGSILNWRINWSLSKNLLTISLPFVGSGILNMLLLRADLFAVRHLLGITDLGVYSVASTIFLLFQFVPIIICSSIFPSLVNAHFRASKEGTRRMILLLRLMMVLGLLIGGLCTAFGPIVIPLLYGPSYIGAINILSVLSWASVFFFVYVAAWRWFLLENLQLLALKMMIVNVIVQVILLLIGIGWWGLIGAAYAMIGAYLFAGFLAFTIWPRSRPLFTMILCAMIPAFLSRRFSRLNLGEGI